MKRKSSTYAVSSSDEESTFTTSTKSRKTDILYSTEDKDSLIEKISKKKNVNSFNFKSLKSSNTLFHDEISDDDELFLVQCPKNTDLTALSNANVDFDSVISNIKCRVNGSKEKFTVYSVDDFPRQINLALPNRRTKSFQLKVMPVAGQLIMQKNIRIRPIKPESECCVIDLE